MVAELPAELWILIFHFAFDDDAVLAPVLPAAWDASSWAQGSDGKWMLRSPQDNIGVCIRRRTGSLKAILSSCRYLRQIGTSFLYESVLIEVPSRILRLCLALDADRHLSRQTKRIHISRYFQPNGVTAEEMDLAVISIIQHCRKLQTFVFDWPLNKSFTPIADALCHYCRGTLHTLHISIPSTELAKLIWTLDSLQKLVALHVEIGERHTEENHLGSASDINLKLPKLQQLSLRGFFTDFVEEAIEWEFPRLTSLTLDFINYRDELPDIEAFLQNHGSQLTYLDINCIPPLDVPMVLDLCPSLTSFSFNPDWRLPRDEVLPYEASSLVRVPHRGITTIGLHQLLYAFGVGYAAQYSKLDAISTRYIRHSNDANFAALTKRNFPNLKTIRLLSRTLLRDLEMANGPDEVCYERWERWWAQCSAQGVRLEDCTGAQLGYLPPQDTSTEGGSMADDEEEEEEDSVIDAIRSFDPIEQVRALRMRCQQVSAALS
ncbi:hypothetical protein BDW22DRAFT_1385820 [Trametopsis cervina]|nr:hypothetical protein BDW22DRAFT_1385820 [Trametopsis cervina]